MNFPSEKKNIFPFDTWETSGTTTCHTNIMGLAFIHLENRELESAEVIKNMSEKRLSSDGNNEEMIAGGNVGHFLPRIGEEQALWLDLSVTLPLKGLPTLRSRTPPDLVRSALTHLLLSSWTTSRLLVVT